MLGYSLVLAPGFRWLKNLPLAGFLTPSERSIENDSTTFALSIILLLPSIAVITPPSVLLILPVFVMFLLDRFFEHEVAAPSFLLILVTSLIAPLVVRLGTIEGQYWSLTLLTVLLYGMSLAKRALKST